MTDSAFNGFPKACLTFLRTLERHNDRKWFQAHRDDYEQHVLEPARSFVCDLGERLEPIAPRLHAEPFVDKAIFRLHRDTRFSKDKRPFKTHLAIFVWEGDGPKLECPGFYFHLEPDQLLIGGGIYVFPSHLLAAYRDAVLDAKHGPALALLMAEAAVDFPGGLQSERYKRVPAGLPKEHPRADLLQWKGLTIGDAGSVPQIIHERGLLDHLAARYERMVPLHRWLLALTKRGQPNR